MQICLISVLCFPIPMSGYPCVGQAFPICFSSQRNTIEVNKNNFILCLNTEISTFESLNTNTMESKLLAKEIKLHLNKHLNNIVSDVVIFGSRAKGTADNDSDYDVLIILDTDYNQKTKKLINGLCYDFDLNYNIFLDTQIISKSELTNSIRGKHPVFKIALKEGLHA